MHQYQTQQSEVINLRTPWFRAKDGLVAGVCAGMARKFNIDPWLIRAGLLLSVFALGFGLAVYIVLAFCLPREDELHVAMEPKLLGVCARVSEHIGVDVGLVRAATVLIGLGSMGTTLLAYLILHFVVDNRSTISSH